MRYTTLLFFAITTLLCSVTLAQPWQFEEPLNVTSISGENIFHHLESSGRRSIAVTETTIAITWEDDRSGNPSVYLALKPIGSKAFNKEIKISGAGEAYEPGIAALNSGQFIIAWEENEQVHARMIFEDKPGPVLKLGKSNSSQASLISQNNQVLVTVSEQGERFSRIKLYRLQSKNLELSVSESCFVDPEPVKNEQLYPVVSTTDEDTIIVWEDRRPGHTIIMASQNLPGENCRFDLPARISQRPPGPKAPFGTGHGVARAAMTRYGDNRLFVLWADKRNFREGYDIYGSEKPASQPFLDNVKIQDDFGGDARQFHGTLAGHANGQLVAAWTDERESNQDVFISWLEDGQWSEDIAVNAASGAGEQAHPSITLDKQGNMHLTWIERPETGAATRLNYVKGKASDNPI